MSNIFSGTGSEYTELRFIGTTFDGADFSIVEHTIALLIEKCHINRETFSSTIALISQCLLCLDEIRNTKQCSGQEITRWNNRQFNDKTTINYWKIKINYRNKEFSYVFFRISRFLHSRYWCYKLIHDNYSPLYSQVKIQHNLMKKIFLHHSQALQHVH